MRVSHFAKLEVIVPPEDYAVGATATASLRTVGMAQSINIEDNFGSRAENTIGSALPVLAPGYQQTTIRVEKATIDGNDFRNLGAFNPLWAHVGATYQNTISLAGQTDLEGASADGMYPFMFVLRVRNKISGSAKFTNIEKNGIVPDLDVTNNTSNPFGIYACVLQSASISATSQQAVIMDNMTAIARPVAGSWLNEKIKEAFSQPAGSEDYRNGMGNLIYDVLYGYIS